MAPSERAARLEELREKDPTNSLTLFMLANEYFKEGRFADTIAVLRDYFTRGTDEGAAYRLLGYSLRKLGEEEAARQAFRDGARVAREHHHDGMAVEFEEESRK